MIRALLISLLLTAACKGKDTTSEPAAQPAPAAPTTPPAPPAPRPPVPDPNVAAACDARIAELKDFLTAVLDPAHKVAPPWPTGDAAFDAELPKLRQAIRDQARPAEGRLDEELASCPPATEQMKQVGEASPAERTATFVGLADGIAACECRSNIPRVKALVYLMLRGAD